MACNSASCQSGCYREEDNQNPHRDNNGSTNGILQHDHDAPKLCVKCKSNATIFAAATGLSGGDAERFCSDCFRSNLYGKFRFAVTSNAMISPSDNVLVAFSGGVSSRVALQFVHEMQSKAQKNYDASRDKSLPVFGVGVAFIDERSVFSVPSDELNEAIEEMKLIVSKLSPPAKNFHVVPTESVYAMDNCEGRDRLSELINSVSDATGKEDLVEYMRMLTLQRVAFEYGYTRLVLGTCTSRIACHVLEATVKGQGYSLAADIQYVDARWEIPVVLPLRDCLSQELNLLCSLDSLEIVEVHNGPRSGINGLISSFVKLLQEENPSRESTIVRTGGKLTPFHFNKIPEVTDGEGRLAAQRRQKKFNLKSIESLPPDSFCTICNSPLKKPDVTNLTNFQNGQTSAALALASCCYSCQFQILPKEPSNMEYFCSLLPPPIIPRVKDDSRVNQRWLREQIQDCLLSDTEDGT